MIRTTVFAVVALLGLGIAPIAAQSGGGPRGNFLDDYGSWHTVNDSLWVHHPWARYHIENWDSGGQFLIARNAATNSTDASAWTRIDWTKLEGMAPWEWAFCLSAYKAGSAAEAEAVTIADRGKPRTGCNGFPFTRLQEP
jgi:hypothetical protein